MNSFDSREQIIGIHIGLSKPVPASLLPRMLGPKNWIGGLLAHYIIQSALLRANLLPGGKMGCIGELWDCVLIANVSDADAAVEIVKAELKQVAVLSVYQIAILEESGWRCVHPPSPGARVNYLFSTERHDAAFEEFKTDGREYARKLETLCHEWRELRATASESERRKLDAAIIEVEGILPPLRASFAAEQGGEETL